MLDWLRTHTGDLWAWAVTGGSGPTAYAVSTSAGVDSIAAVMGSLVAICVVAVVTGQLIPKPKHMADLRFREGLLSKRDDQVDAMLSKESSAVKAVEDLRAEIHAANSNHRRGQGGR